MSIKKHTEQFFVVWLAEFIRLYGPINEKTLFNMIKDRMSTEEISDYNASLNNSGVIRWEKAVRNAMTRTGRDRPTRKKTKHLGFGEFRDIIKIGEKGKLFATQAQAHELHDEYTTEFTSSSRAFSNRSSTPTSTTNTTINLSSNEIINLSDENLNAIKPEEARELIKTLVSDMEEESEKEKDIVDFFLKIRNGNYPQFKGYELMGREWSHNTPDGTKYFFDILLYNKRYNHYIIIEFKRGAVSFEAFGQITMYLNMFRNHSVMIGNETVSGYLIGTEIGTDMLAMINDENPTLGVGIYNNGEFSTVYDQENNRGSAFTAPLKLVSVC